jgi:hypothetical protein
MNNPTKQKFINEMNDKYDNLYFCDLDVITNDVRDSRRLNVLTKAIDESKSQIKKKELEKELNDFWKDSLTKRLTADINDHKNEIIIVVGLSTFYLNHKTKIDIDTPNKYFLKVNTKLNAKEIIEYNLKTYGEYIVDGTFPIKYLDYDFLIDQREKLMVVYENLKYSMKSYATLVKALDVMLNDQKKQRQSDRSPLITEKDTVTIWFSSPTRHDITISEYDGESRPTHPIGYKEVWLSVLASVKNNNEYFKKGYAKDGDMNEPYIEERFAGALKNLNTSTYLYEVKSDKRHQINNFKYRLPKNIPFDKRTLIPNVHNFLKDSGVRIVKFRY